MGEVGWGEGGYVGEVGGGKGVMWVRWGNR